MVDLSSYVSGLCVSAWLRIKMTRGNIGVVAAAAAWLVFSPVLLAQDPPSPPAEKVVDLTDESEESIDLALKDQEGGTLGRAWFQNIHISGFGAVGFLDTGQAGTKKDAGFMVKESSLFVDAEAWDNISIFAEIQVNRLGKDDSLFVRTGEVYARFQHLLVEELGGEGIGVKVGRIDIPFGEEYLWQDSIDNPMITQSAAYPYGFDEGLLLHGSYADVDWIASITDGNDPRSVEDGDSKAYNLKLSSNLCDNFYVSASGMVNGLAGKSAFEFGGSHFEPLGASHPSSAGTSASMRVDAALYEVDVIYTVPDAVRFAGSFGEAHVSDEMAGFDRDILWFMGEARVDLSEKIMAIGRVSEIGTYSNSEGYHFDGKTIAGGNSAFGYDTKRLQRLAVGLAYRPNVNTVLKAEVGRDRFWVIDASTFNAGADSRFYFGFELALRF